MYYYLEVIDFFIIIIILGHGHSHSHCHDHSHSHDHSYNHIHSHSNIEIPSETSSLIINNENHGHEGQMNLHAIYLHVLGDALASIAVIVTAIIINYTSWKYRYIMDPIVSICITLLIIKFTIPLMKNTTYVLLQGVPNSVNLSNIRREILSVAF